MYIAKFFGFTLIELIVTMTIVSILAFLGFSGYMDYLRVERRKDGVIALKKAMLVIGDSLANPDDPMPIVCTSDGTQDYIYDESSQNCKSPAGFYLVNYKKEGFLINNNSVLNNLRNNEIVWLKATAIGPQVNDNKNGIDCTKIFLTNFSNVYPLECAN